MVHSRSTICGCPIVFGVVLDRICYCNDGHNVGKGASLQSNEKLYDSKIIQLVLAFLVCELLHPQYKKS